MASSNAQRASRFSLAALRMRPRDGWVFVAPSGLVHAGRIVPISETVRLSEPLTT